MVISGPEGAVSRKTRQQPGFFMPVKNRAVTENADNVEIAFDS